MDVDALSVAQVVMAGSQPVCDAARGNLVSRHEFVDDGRVEFAQMLWAPLQKFFDVGGFLAGTAVDVIMVGTRLWRWSC